MLQMPIALQVSLPPRFSSFLSIFRFLSLDFISLIPVDCIKHINFIENLVISTLLPFAAFLFLILAALLIFTCQSGLSKLHTFSTNCSILQNVFMFSIYLCSIILPGISVKILHTFVCFDIDPLRESGLSYTFVLKDHPGKELNIIYI